MRWPPNKAWTSSTPQKGYRHYVAINYGGKGKDRWVNLVSVLDGNARLRIFWEDLSNPLFWSSGWQQISNNDPKPLNHDYIEEDYIDNINEPCLHPSEDSGLQIPCNQSPLRPWNS